MLRRLVIQNFILIETLSIEWGEGICLLSGETGAGKSIIIDALGALLGDRAGADVIRTGSDRTYLEAVFQYAPTGPLAALLAVEDIEPAVEGELLISREITVRGSRCRVEGKPVTQQVLRQLGERLVDIMGQHEHQLLTRPREHMDMLDRFGGPPVLEALATYQDLYREVGRLGKQVAEHEAKAMERARNLQFLLFQQHELASVELYDPGEEDLLREELVCLSHAVELRQATLEAHEALRGEKGALGLLSRAQFLLRQKGEMDPRLASFASTLEEALAIAEDVAGDLRRHGDNLEEDPDRLAQVEERLGVLAGLERKYGPTLVEVIAHRDQVNMEVLAAQGDDHDLEGLRAEKDRQAAALRQAGALLSRLRGEAGERLAQGIHAQLCDLGMPGATFCVRLSPLAEDVLGSMGLEQVEFLIAPNRGEPLRPLAKTASGGELSRIMLGIKVLLAASEGIPTLVLDEVDTGISGKAAQAVARKIALLGQQAQVMLITHLPAIAAVARHHYRVEKTIQSTDGEARTQVAVTRLDRELRIRELAQMTSGGDSPEALAHASQLLNEADANVLSMDAC